MKIIKTVTRNLILTSSFLFASNNIPEVIKLPTLSLEIKKSQDLGNVYMLRANVGNKPTVVFLTKDKRYIIFGQAINLKTGEIVSFPIDVNKLKKHAAFKVGQGEDEYFVFTDPECPFCKKFEKQIPELSKHATFYFYLFPLTFHPHSKQMSLYILSLPKEKRAKALYDVQIKNSKEYENIPQDKLKQAEKELSEQMEIAQEIGVTGTPTVYNKEGKKVNWIQLRNKYNIHTNLDAKAIKFIKMNNSFICIKNCSKKQKDNKEYIIFLTTLDKNHINMIKRYTEKLNGKIYLILAPRDKVSLIKSFIVFSSKNPEKEIFSINNRKINLQKAKEFVDKVPDEIKKKVYIPIFIAQKEGITEGVNVFNDEGKFLKGFK